MREIRTSGSMSGDGKRSVAAWPKLPRPSSTLPPRRIAAVRRFGRDRSEADMPRASGAGRSDENAPKRPLADTRAHLRKGMLWNVRDKRWISPA